MSHASTPSGEPSGMPQEGEPSIELPGYRDFTLVASGGESRVYRAVQVGVDRPVAVKVLVGEEGEAAAARYRRELEITVRLGRAHPNIVTVIDTQFLPTGQPCIVMEYYELGSLQDQLRAHGPLPASAVVAVGTVVADALAFAHAQGVLHRDIKPHNILVLPTSFVLADFGLARPVDAGHTASLERFSYRHASPQVLDGELPTVADDIYSLGSTLYTLLDGRTPFAVEEPESDSALAYLRRARSELPRPIRSSDASPQLLAIIDRCLAKRREDRFADAAQLRDALSKVVTHDAGWARSWAPQPLPGRGSEPVAPVSAAPVAATPVSAAPVSATPVSATPVSAAPVSAAPVSPRPVSAIPISPSVVPLSPSASSVSVAPAPTAVPRVVPAQPVPAPRVVPVSAAPAPRVINAGPVAGPLPVLPPARPAGPQWADRPGYDERFRDDVTGPPPVDPDRDDGGTRWGRIAVLAVVALVLGTALGLGAWWLAGRMRAEPDSREGLPSYQGTLPAVVSTMSHDPALDFEIVQLIDHGTSVELTWTDPSGGQASFIVVRIEEGKPTGDLAVEAGVTSAVVDGLQPAEEYCFRVLLIQGDSLGTSRVHCRLGGLAT